MEKEFDLFGMPLENVDGTSLADLDSGVYIKALKVDRSNPECGFKTVLLKLKDSAFEEATFCTEE